MQSHWSCCILYHHISQWRSNILELLPGKPSASVLEAEYPASHFATNDSTYFRQYMYELGFPQTSPTIIYSHNAATVQLNEERRMTHLNRHINMKYHSQRWSREQNIVQYVHVPTVDNISDIGTNILKDVAQYQRFTKILCYDCVEFKDT